MALLTCVRACHQRTLVYRLLGCCAVRLSADRVPFGPLHAFGVDAVLDRIRGCLWPSHLHRGSGAPPRRRRAACVSAHLPLWCLCARTCHAESSRSLCRAKIPSCSPIHCSGCNAPLSRPAPTRGPRSSRVCTGRMSIPVLAASPEQQAGPGRCVHQGGGLTIRAIRMR